MRLGNPCTFCGQSLQVGSQRVVRFQIIYHGLLFIVYLSLLITFGVQWKNKTLLFFEPYWKFLALCSAHFTIIFVVFFLHLGRVRSSPRIILLWLFLFGILIIGQLIVLCWGVDGNFLGQIPLVLLDLYCFWVGWALREHIRYIRNTRDEIPMMAIIRCTPCVPLINSVTIRNFVDRADGEIALSEKDSSNEKFGYRVHTSTCGYAQVPSEALENTTCISASYYRQSYFPIPPSIRNSRRQIGNISGGGLGAGENVRSGTNLVAVARHASRSLQTVSTTPRTIKKIIRYSET